jgi:hypothetical protein
VERIGLIIKLVMGLFAAFSLMSVSQVINKANKDHKSRNTADEEYNSDSYDVDYESEYSEVESDFGEPTAE